VPTVFFFIVRGDGPNVDPRRGKIEAAQEPERLDGRPIPSDCCFFQAVRIEVDGLRMTSGGDACEVMRTCSGTSSACRSACFARLGTSCGTAALSPPVRTGATATWLHPWTRRCPRHFFNTCWDRSTPTATVVLIGGSMDAGRGGARLAIT